jgi:tRNA 2-thiouridine synthesizing protein A
VSDAGEDPSADLRLDCRGLRCPVPVIRLATAIGEVPVGGVVAVEADDPATRADVPAWCRMRGQEYVGERAAEDGTPAYLVRRRG